MTMNKFMFGFLKKKEVTRKHQGHTSIELSDEEMMGIEGASNDFIDHFYEQDRVKGILDPIYQKTL